MGGIRVLELIDEDVLVAAVISRERPRSTSTVERPEEQVIEIEGVVESTVAGSAGRHGG